MWLYMSTLDEVDVATQVLAVFKGEPGWEELLVDWIAKLRSSCAMYSSPVSFSADLFACMAQLVSGDVHQRRFLVTLGFSCDDV